MPERNLKKPFKNILVKETKHWFNDGETYRFRCFMLFDPIVLHNLLALESPVIPAHIKNALLLFSKTASNFNKTLSICPIDYHQSKSGSAHPYFFRKYGAFTGLWKNCRDLLLWGIYEDYDLKGSFPNILFYICKKNNINAAYLKEFVSNNDYWQKKCPHFKPTFTRILNATDNYPIISTDKEVIAFLKNWQTEKTVILRLLADKHDLKSFKIFNFCERIESEIMEDFFFFLLATKNWNHVIWLHDGMYLLQNKENDALIKQFNLLIQTKYDYPFEFRKKELTLDPLFKSALNSEVTYSFKGILSLEQKERFYNNTILDLPYVRRINFYKFKSKYAAFF